MIRGMDAYASLTENRNCQDSFQPVGTFHSLQNLVFQLPALVVQLYEKPLLFFRKSRESPLFQLIDSSILFTEAISKNETKIL